MGVKLTDTWETMPQAEKDYRRAQQEAHKMLCAAGEHDWSPCWKASDGLAPSVDVCIWCNDERKHIKQPRKLV